MDKEARKISREQNSVTSEVANSQQQQQSTRRTAGTKFNRILNNLERSILNRFSNNPDSSAQTQNPKSKSYPSTKKTTTTTTASSVKVNTNKNSEPQQSVKKCNETQVQKDQYSSTSPTDSSNSRHKISLQQDTIKANGEASLADKGGKMTLNKYQQQIVSTMRANQLLVNNKLSIPPPHANDEARNQSHQLLFGASMNTVLNKSHDAADGLMKQSHSAVNVSDKGKHAGIKNVASKQQDHSDADINKENRNKLNECSTKNNTTTQTGANSTPSKSGSQIDIANRGARNTQDDEEDCGFSTYQSRRSISGSINSPTKSSVPTSSATITQTTPTISGETSNNLKPGNMILMQANQVPLSAVGYNPHSHQLLTNGGIITHPFVYNYQSQLKPQMSNQQHPQFISTHHLVPSNQVPTFDISNSTNINCYINNNQPNQRYNQHINHQYNDQSYLQRQPAPIYNMFGQNVAFMPVSTIDNNQQIYANAPPKPRRYQYYDGNQIMLQVPPPMTTTPNLLQPGLATTTTTSPLSGAHPASNNNSHIQMQSANLQGYLHISPQHMQNQPTKQNVFTDQPIYNMNPYLQASTVYQQGLPSNAVNVVGFKPATNQPPPHNQFDSTQARHFPPPLTKSKSSLDACDLNRFKQEKLQHDVHQQQSYTLRNNRQLGQLPSITYNSRYDESNRYTNNPAQCQQPSMFAQNLQRSKSVTHLIPDYDTRQQLNQQHHQQSRESAFDSRNLASAAPPMVGPKFLSVSSASTTNLNYVGLSNYNQQISQPNQFAKISSQMNISYQQQHQQQQQQQQQYNNSIQQQRNQLSATMAFRHQQQQSHQQQLQLQQNQQSPNNWTQSNYQHQSSHNQNTNDLNNQNRINFKGNNPAFSNNTKLQVKQSARTQQASNISQTESSFNNKPTLDDKIRHLLIGGDDIDDNKPTQESNLIDNSTIYQQQSTKNEKSSGNLSGARNQTEKQQASLTPFLSAQQQHQQPPVTGILSNNLSAVHQYNQSELGDRVYLNKNSPPTRMGNLQQRQYQVAEGENSTNDSQSASLNGKIKVNNEQNLNRKNDSQLIVDLTTPRVLARTQTTIQPTIDKLNDSKPRDSWSMNQVGLPQPVTQHNDSKSTTHSSISAKPNQSKQQQVTQNNEANIQQESARLDSNERNSQKHSITERTAPYYYSDLKSDEQRKALLNIVQQKSLSPPPQLLSRSADQSNTRLGPKSATLHSNQAKMLSESLARKQYLQINSAHESPANEIKQNDFSSASNIAKNIDKLFCDSPTQSAFKHLEDQRTNTVSMLALNGNNNEIANTDSSHLSSFQATSESISSGYCSGELRGRNFSKSKSLENISQHTSASDGLDNENMIDGDKFKTPVYENIRRSDKLMNAICNSTTCLSTSTSRNNRNQNSYPLDSKNLEGSMDSILGSSLEDSSSSLDIMDDVKVAPSTDNSLRDITQLIEQLKNNHSKLTEEYKSTMISISKTISAKNSESNGDHKNERLARRLHLLELKSKKCESRSNNQLALIQMMEKVLRQSKVRSSNNINGQKQQQQQQHQQQQLGTSFENSITGLVESEPQSIGQREQLCSSPCLSFDYQNIKLHNELSNNNVATVDDRQRERTSSLMNHANSKSSNCAKSQPSSNHSNEPSVSPMSKHNVIKAIVTEGKNPFVTTSSTKFVTSNCGQKSLHSNLVSKQQNSVSLSTLHQQSLQNQSKNLLASSSAAAASNGVTTANANTNKSAVVVEKKTSNIESRNGNPFCSEGSNNGDADDSASSTASSSMENELPMNLVDKSSSSNLMGRDDEDFIEFLSNDSSSHQHRSQFEASQFSASDFNTSSNSESSTSGACTDSLSASLQSANEVKSKARLSANHNRQATQLFKNGSTTTGILKSSKSDREMSGKKGTDKNNFNNANTRRSAGSMNVKSCSSSGSGTNTTTTTTTTATNGTSSTNSDRSHNIALEEKSKFNNVLGNVIDVDVCPMNNLSHCSPVNNQASCMN